MNRFIFPIFFGGILLIAAMCLMLFQQMQTEDVAKADSKSEDAEVTQAEPGGSGASSGMVFALKMMWENATGAATVRPKVSLKDLGPRDVEGWFAQDYRTSDGEEITQATFSSSSIVKTAQIHCSKTSMMLRMVSATRLSATICAAVSGLQFWYTSPINTIVTPSAVA